MNKNVSTFKGWKKASLFIEILAAFVIVVLVLVPLLGSFTTGIRQTQSAKSYMTGHAIGTWAVAQAKSIIGTGLASAETNADITADVKEAMPDTVKQLAELKVLRSMSQIGTDSKCFSIGVKVVWKDYKVKRQRVMNFQSIARSEI